MIVIYGVCGSFGFHLQVVISSYGADPHFFLIYLCRRLIAINPYWVRLVIASSLVTLTRSDGRPTCKKARR